MARRIFAGLSALTLLLLLPSISSAQDNPSAECDNRFGDCGTPDTSGGGGCGCGGGGSILVANTDLGDTYQSADDWDDDGIEDPSDNCPRQRNLEQLDADGDGHGDQCDNCRTIGNLDQGDLDGDAMGDLCDDDRDGDVLDDLDDNCPNVPNPFDPAENKQLDMDRDGIGDACDDDIDQDGIPNLEDACPLDKDILEPADDDQAKCFPDTDRDGIGDFDPLGVDNCRNVANEDQADTDGDGIGDACDNDIDQDGILNNRDNCALVANPAQDDADRDDLGNDCDDLFCYTVFGDEENCLDPSAPFEVYTPNLMTDAGDEFRLRLFANRENQGTRYTWTVEDAPSGSSATVDNAKGSVTESSPYEYHYPSGEQATFRPDRPGLYVIKLTAVSIFEDAVTHEVEVTASHEMELSVGGEGAGSEGGGDDDGGGCSSIGASGPAALALVALLALGLVGRRRDS